MPTMPRKTTKEKVMSHHSCPRTAGAVVGFTALIALGLLSGCGAAGDRAATREDRAADPEAPVSVGNDLEVEVEADEEMRFESLEDWVTFSDHVVVAEVSDETEMPSDPSQESLEGFVDRTVELTILDTIYSFPDASDLPVAPIEMVAWGSFEDDSGVERPLTSGGARFEVGSQYLVALQQITPGEWAELTTTSVFRVENDIVLGQAGDTGVRASLAGLTVEDVADQLNSTAINDVITVHTSLDAYERWVTVTEAEF